MGHDQGGWRDIGGVDLAFGSSFASATAMQPEPVPMSARVRPSPVNLGSRPERSFADGEAIEGDFDEVLGFGAGN